MTKNHSKSMSQPERSFWRDVYVAALKPLVREGRSAEYAGEHAATYADLAVKKFRERITWRT